MHLFEIYQGEAGEIVKTLSNKAQHVLADLYLEGKMASIECLRDFQALERGEITPQDFMARSLEREKQNC